MIPILTTLAITLFFFVLRWDVYSDYKKWKENIPVKHTKEAIIRGVLLLPSISLLVLVKLIGNNFTFSSLLLYLFLTIGLLGALWWEFFDGWYNTLRGFKWRFNGSVDEDDALTDRILYKIGDFWEGVLKIGLILLFAVLYFIL